MEQELEFGAWDIRIWGFRFGFLLGFWCWALGLKVWVCWVFGLGLRVWVCWVFGLGFRVWGFSAVEQRVDDHTLRQGLSKRSGHPNSWSRVLILSPKPRSGTPGNKRPVPVDLNPGAQHTG